MIFAAFKWYALAKGLWKAYRPGPVSLRYITEMTIEWEAA